MPVRDGARWLRQAVDSVLGQTLRNFELVAVDDGSTDETPGILAGYQSLDARVRVVRTARAGLVAALNRGLAEARAPLIARLDADDAAMPDRLARQAAFMRDKPGTELLGSWAEIVDARSRHAGIMRRPTGREHLVQALDRENPFIHSSVVFRTRTVRTLGGYRPAFAAAEDHDLWCRISEVGEVANLDACLIRYRRHAGGVTRTDAVRQVFSVRLARRAHAIRKMSGRDPADGLTEPPDLFAPEADAAFYAEDAKICRFLALSERDALSAPALARIDFAAFRRGLPSLSRGERRLAQRAAANLITSRDLALPASRPALLRLLVTLHPGRAAGFLPQLLARRPPSPSSTAA